MEGLNFSIFIIISSGLSILLLAWAFFVKSRTKNFNTDISKQFVTSSVLNFRTTLKLCLSITTVFLLSLILKNSSLEKLISRENLLLLVPFILSLILVLKTDKQSRKN
ncbi:putative integral membrane protein [Halobacteriovorax marinus SJ]|uniref:Integral membrane protein n=1 Tax=Halobacteriovorax marinus (strain ATCC BAA-682 / DSM 15412 / SJ) TaxID=862908 RepID=E1X1Q4_HALMS|nr:putative integral membrane protein [Halobacteriovorax marinus SJ]